MAIKVGQTVRDLITGFEGVVTARIEFLYGCVRLTVEPKTLDKDGNPSDGFSFDEQRCEVVKATKPKVSKDSTAPAGGPAGEEPASTVRRADASREDTVVRVRRPRTTR